MFHKNVPQLSEMQVAQNATPTRKATTVDGSGQDPQHREYVDEGEHREYEDVDSGEG